jgi:hypothetical protein
MKNLTFDELKATLHSVCFGVCVDGDIVRVDSEDGALVILEEAEFSILQSALRGIFAVSGALAESDKISAADFDRLIAKLGGTP